MDVNNEFELVASASIELLTFEYETPNKIFCVILCPVSGIEDAVTRKFKIVTAGEVLNEVLIKQYWTSIFIDNENKQLFELNT